MTVSSIPPPRRYFAASNSCRGFCNYYDRCFSPDRVQRLYIIKGGPGTGKSHFMKAIARRAREKGYDVTEYYCSSDPASLDGVLLEREGCPAVGLLDGTAPHVCEPTVPGVREEIVNLGEFWDGKRLVEQGDTIRSLGAGKAAAYDRAYAFLRACGDMEAVADSLTEPCVRTDKLRSLAARLLRHQPSGERYTPIPALRRAVSMAGEACFHTFEAESAALGGTLVMLDGLYGMGYRLTSALVNLSEERCHTVKVSYDPVYPHKIDGLLYPDTGLCILVGHAEAPEGAVTRILSLRRYTDPEALRRVRSELRRVYSLRDRLADDALHSLAAAASHHFELEKIYSEAMDFPAKERFTDRFCENLFISL